MATARVIIQDEVNVQLRGVDRSTLDKIVEAQSYYAPKYMFSPKYNLGHWNGMISLAKSSGRVFLNLLDEVGRILENQGYDLHVEDLRPDWAITLSPFDENYLSQYKIKNETVIIRDYQIDAIKTAIEHGNGVLTIGTGGGKTLVCAVLSKLYLEHGLVLVIVPNIDLVFQTTATFRNFGVDCGMWYGELKEAKPCVISTWQSLENTPELFHDVITVIVDESHGVKGKILGDLLCGPGAHVPFRFGVTGTLPGDELSRYQIQAALGPHIFDLPSWELQELGELAESHINMVALRDSKNDDFLIASQDHEDWLDEVKWLAGCSERIDFIAEFVREIAKSGNTLVLTQYRVMGDALAEALGTTYIDGRMKSEKRVERYKEIDKQDNQIDVASLGVASTGIDIPRLYNIVFIEPGRAMIKTMQAIGRGLRLSKGSDGMDAKTVFTLWDLHGDEGFAIKHAEERRRLYKKAKHAIEKLEVDYL